MKPRWGTITWLFPYFIFRLHFTEFSHFLNWKLRVSLLRVSHHRVQGEPQSLLNQLSGIPLWWIHKLLLLFMNHSKPSSHLFVLLWHFHLYLFSSSGKMWHIRCALKPKRNARAITWRISSITRSSPPPCSACGKQRTLTLQRALFLSNVCSSFIFCHSKYYMNEPHLWWLLNNIQIFIKNIVN